MTNGDRFFVSYPTGRQAGPFSEQKARLEAGKALQDSTVPHTELYRELPSGARQFVERITRN